MTAVGSNKPEIEHVKRIFQNAGNLISVYQRNTDPVELLLAIQGDIDYLRQHYKRTRNPLPVRPEQSQPSRPAGVTLNVPVTANDDGDQEWVDVNIALDVNEFKQEFGLSKKKYQAIRVNAQILEANSKNGTRKLIMDGKVTESWQALTPEQKVDQITRIKKKVLEIPKEWGGVGINYQAFKASNADTTLVLNEFIRKEIENLCTKGGRKEYARWIARLANESLVAPASPRQARPGVI